MQFQLKKLCYEHFFFVLEMYKYFIKQIYCRAPLNCCFWNSHLTCCWNLETVVRINDSLLFPLKASENQGFFNVFRGHKKGTALEWINNLVNSSVHDFNDYCIENQTLQVKDRFLKIQSLQTIFENLFFLGNSVLP